MFSRILTKPSTKSCSEPMERLKAALQDCDAVVIGAGAGLSTAAGFTYTGERFEKYFSDFAAKYGIQDMYSGGFFPFATPEEHWAYWSRYIYINRYHKCFTTAEAEKAVLKAENESLTDKLKKSQQQSTLKKLQDAKLQSDYEAAQAVLERIPPDIIKAYAQRGNRERKVDQYSALE